ncbi:MAG: YggT family protein [Acidimicrobiaceae bacterium]|jgi:YggT family protein|nr:YggT family protein [Acidimicrobiaceae bacterium]
MFSLSSNPLCLVAQLYVLILIARAILSWFPLQPNSPFIPVNRFLNTVTEPVLAPFRRVIPAAGMLDLSFLVVVLLFEFLIVPLLCSIHL